MITEIKPWPKTTYREYADRRVELTAELIERDIASRQPRVIEPWHGTQPAPIYVSKAMLEDCARHDKIQAYDVDSDAYKVEGFWCKILPKIL